MWAIIDEHGKIAEAYYEDSGRICPLIFNKKETAENELGYILAEWHDELEDLKSIAKCEGKKPEDYEDYEVIIKNIRYFEKCKIKKIEIIFEE